MKDALDTTHEITKLIKKSPSRDACFQRLKTEIAPDTPGIRVLCPTRWTVRAEALQSILENYQVLHELWMESADTVKDTEMKACIFGVESQMKRSDYFYGVTLRDLILRHSDKLSRTLQKTDISSAEGQEVAELTVQMLKSLGSNSIFNFFWKTVTKVADTLDIGAPHLPCCRKAPRRFELGHEDCHFPATLEDHYRWIYFQAIDLMIACINDRFNQTGYQTYKNVQDLLLKAPRGEDYQTQFDFVTHFNGSNFNPRPKGPSAIADQLKI